MRTIFWATLTLLVVLCVCSIMAVEMFHPVVVKLIAKGKFEECDRCPIAYSSVSNAMITFLGIAILIVFVMIVYLGFSNLILSVIVEKADQARNADAEYQNILHQQAAEDVKNGFRNVWRASEFVGDDGDVSFSLEDLRQQYAEDENFRCHLESLDMDLPVLEYAFNLVDRKSSGDVSFDDLAECVAKLRNTDTGPMIQFIKAQVSRLVSDVSFLRNELAPGRCTSKPSLGSSRSGSRRTDPEGRVRCSKTESLSKSQAERPLPE
eukprot:CAMPEP_0179058460 /NCGR_PEP_ID=MMETSP0796-20121207/24859_1 /TAXON_ID=73915 /ORGANISM="Pyrodinium bahamense, Strain pbaha01" /LENGTH=264 /DNA_ID=CAMNT_0020755207 /DNA_START=5 /DNA_END=797 /DNA_ORIENTATION=+